MGRDEAARTDVLGEVPSEFLDPILNTLMTDPVILPASGITMDRAVICRHLLSTQTDPFCREPLTPDMLRSDTALLERITAWREQQLQRETQRPPAPR